MAHDENTARDFCGQTQPHAAHNWSTPQSYGVCTFISVHQCGGYVVSPSATESGEVI